MLIATFSYMEFPFPLSLAAKEPRMNTGVTQLEKSSNRQHGALTWCNPQFFNHKHFKYQWITTKYQHAYVTTRTKSKNLTGNYLSNSLSYIQTLKPTIQTTS